MRTVRSRAAVNWTLIRGSEGRRGTPRRARMTRNRTPQAAWAVTLAIADPRIPIPAPNTSSAERPMLHEVGEPDHDERGARVLERPHPPLRRGRHQHERRAQRSDPHPLNGLRRGGSVTARHGVHRRNGDDLEDGRQEQAQNERKPGGLHAHVERLVVVPGAVQPRRPGGGAVLEEGAEPEHLREEQPRQREPGQRDGAQVADDRRVAQDVQRLGDQGTEGGDGERQDLAIGRHPGLAAHAGSLAGRAGQAGR